MASPSTNTLKKDRKDGSFLDKIGVINRKKKPNEGKRVPSTAIEVVEEGRQAIEAPTSPTKVDLGPDGYLLEEQEERSMLEPGTKDDPKLQELIKLLLDWINDVLAENRILVKDLEEDLFDGQILQKLIEKLSHKRLEVTEVSQSETGQKQKLRVVLAAVTKILQLPQPYGKWTVDSIHAKSLVAILHLLVALAQHYRAPIRIPANIHIALLIVQKQKGVLTSRRVVEQITPDNDVIHGVFERDAFDTLFDHAPDKLIVVKKSLISFVNKHLERINLDVTDMETQFHDGVYFVLLMGLLENYFVPLYHFHSTPTSFDQKVHNVQFAFQLMQDSGLPKPKTRPEDIVNQDLKSTLRVLYNLFTKYKTIG